VPWWPLEAHFRVGRVQCLLIWNLWPIDDTPMRNLFQRQVQDINQQGEGRPQKRFVRPQRPTTNDDRRTSAPHAVSPDL